MTTRQVEILYFGDCPNWAVTDQRLRDALSRTLSGLEVAVSYRAVATAEEAKLVGLRGSPTILVDGRDPWASDEPFGLACRIYHTERGPEGAPSVEQLAAVLAG